MATGHHRLLASAHEKGILSRPEVRAERNSVSAYRHMLKLERNFLFRLDARLARREAAERADVKTPSDCFSFPI